MEEQGQQSFERYVGIDWATQAHEVCVMAPDRSVMHRRSVEQKGAGISEFVTWLTGVSGGRPETTAVGIEVPHGSIVEALVDRGFAVFAINPKQMDRFRDRHAVAGSKDDRLDAFVIADSLRTDMHCFRRVVLSEPIVVVLREHSRIVDELREEINRLANRLREQLARYYGQALEISPAADEPWFWELVTLAPTPARAAKLSEARIAKVLKRHRIRRITAAEVATKLREPSLPVAPGVVDAAQTHVLLLVPRLQLALEQRAASLRQMDQILEQLAKPTENAPGQDGEHRDVEILRSFPGLGRIVAAAMLAEAPQLLLERDYYGLRALAGIAPITRRSGKKLIVIMRQACNERLRNALYHWARVAVMHDDPCRAHYAEHRRQGNTHGHALRSVADRLLRILCAALRSNTLYSMERVRRVPPGATAPLSQESDQSAKPAA